MAMLLATGLARGEGVMINTTPSLPMGIWQTRPLPPLHAGLVVTFCPPATAPFLLGVRRLYIAGGNCPSGLEPMMKPIAALPGQVVTVATSGLTVDGHRLVNSVPLPRDYEGRALPVIRAGTYKVPAGEVWLVSSFNPRSYDSRYFGPVAVTDIVASARPLLTDANP